jgi:hypothetical protein
MIVTKLMGGLGNQMFQYAAGKALAMKHDVPLFIDESFLDIDPGDAYTKRTMELGQLNVSLKRAGSTISRKLQKRSLLRKIFTGSASKVLNEGIGFNRNFFSAGNTVYLNGFWQSELYFAGIKEILIHEYTPRYVFSQVNKKYLEKIKKVNSVSIHVRRGDYIKLKSAGSYHGVTGMDYYTKAINYFESHQSGYQYYVFSDDMTWCRENFSRVKNITFVESDNEYSSVDLFLMKNCRHNIICNSSYSWWSAWLNENHDKIVVAPKKWFAAPRKNDELIYGKTWIRL